MEEEKKIDWDSVMINITGLALQGLLERETSVVSKLASDVFADKMAKHAVKLAAECVKHLKEELEPEYEY
jgi:hypothetical protein